MERLLAAADRYFEAEDYRSAALLYRKVLQLDQRHGLAYHSLARVQARQGDSDAAAGSYWRAYELQRDGREYDAFEPLAEIYLKFYMASERQAPQLMSELLYLVDLEREKSPNSLSVLKVEGLIAFAEQQYEDSVERLERVHRRRPEEDRTRIALCHALMQAGESDGAHELALAGVEQSPGFSGYYDFLHEYYVETGEKSKAREVRADAIRRTPERIENWLALAAHFFRFGEHSNMTRLLNRVADDHKRFPGGQVAVGDFYLRAGDTEAAIGVYKAGIAADPERQRSYQNGILQALLVQRRTGEAIELLGEILESDPGDVDALSLRAAIHRDRNSEGSQDLAIGDLVAAVRLEPDNPFLRHALGETYLQYGDVHGASLQFAEARRRAPRFLLPKLAIANILFTNSEFVPAKVLLEEVLRFHPRHRGARLLLADCWIGLRELGEARTLLDGVLEDEPRDLDALNAMARLAVLNRDYRDAHRIYSEIRSDNPGERRALDGMVGSLLAMRRVDEAKQLLQAELEQAPDDADLHMGMGLLHRRFGDLPQAIAEFGKVIVLAPGNARAHTRLGEALIRTGQIEEAKAALVRAAALDSSYSEPLVHLGVLRLAASEPVAAREHFEEALSRTPDSVVALNNLSFLLLDQGWDPDRALSLAQRARALAPDNLAVADTLGIAYLERGLTEQAVPIFRQLIQAQPHRTRYRVKLIRALAEGGQRDEARKELTGLLAGGIPSSAESRDDLAALRHLLGV